MTSSVGEKSRNTVGSRYHQPTPKHDILQHDDLQVAPSSPTLPPCHHRNLPRFSFARLSRNHSSKVHHQSVPRCSTTSDDTTARDGVPLRQAEAPRSDRNVARHDSATHATFTGRRLSAKARPRKVSNQRTRRWRGAASAVSLVWTR